MESLNLAAAVAEEFADPHNTRKHLVKNFRLFTFCENFAALCDMDHCAGGAQRFRSILPGHPGGAGLDGRCRGEVADCHMCRHCCLLKRFTPCFLTAAVQCRYSV
jgi:hypothetical protein